MIDQYAEYSGVVKKGSEARSKSRWLSGMWRCLSRTEKLLLALFLVGLCARFVARPWAPLWLDEAATGAIIGQPNLGAFWQEVYWEVSSPLYFIFMRGWQAIFGLSDLSLRAPSTLFSMGAPLCILFANVPGLQRRDKFCWAALVALWIPGIGYGQDARCYALVLLLSTLQTLAYIRVLDTPSIRNSAIWMLFVALTISAHYDAAPLALFQGLLFLAKSPRDVIKCSPTGIIVIPSIILILWQWPEMARFMRPDTTWYQPFTPVRALSGALYLLGNGLWLIIMPILIIVAAIIGRKFPAKSQIGNAAILTSLASILAATALILIAMHRPILTMRYLAPFAPGVLLFIIVSVHLLARGRARWLILSVPVCAAIFLLLWVARGAHHTDSVVDELNYEEASNIVMQSGTRHVVFAWDHPNAAAMHPEQIKAFGDFFFQRAGYQADLIALKVGSKNPNAALLAAARPAHAAIIWIYDTNVHGTAAERFPPNISQLDKSWTCQNLGKDNFGVVVCLPGDRGTDTSGASL